MDKYRIIICEDSKAERLRFYKRQYDNFEIHGVRKENDIFIEEDPVDSVEKLHKLIMHLKKERRLPDLVLLDLFYLRPIDNVADLEKEFIRDVNKFKDEFRRLRNQANNYLCADGVEFLKRIRLEDKISNSELPITAYTDKNFNFLSSDDFNLLYELDPSFIYKDRDDDEPRSQIGASAEYFKLLRIIESSKGNADRGKIFISHGHSSDWLEVQRYIEHDLGLKTLELSQAKNMGRTVIEKLNEESSHCCYAVIVMTGDDVLAGDVRARENVMHEIGFFQGKLGLNNVCILHEKSTNIPSNLAGVVYIPYSKGSISAAFHSLGRELL